MKTTNATNATNHGLSRVDWEMQVVEHIETMLDMTTGDVQGMIEVPSKEFLLVELFMNGASPAEAAIELGK